MTDDTIEFAPELPDVAPPPDWLIDAADLLAEPDPGPTRWLVEDLIVDQALIAAVGKWKTTKSYGLLEICIAVATGRPAFGMLKVPEPGPVVFVNEESGKAALWRRLDSLCRGRGINPEELRGRLHVAPNKHVKLDDPDWQERLIKLGKELQPRLFVFDPLARMKAASRQEKEQSDMGVLVEYMLLLRDETAATVAFVQHQGHQGEHMRGTSDLESAWETKLKWKRDGQSKSIAVEVEHREADASPTLTYLIKWDGLTRTMRFDSIAAPTRETNAHDEVVAYLAEHPGASGREVEDAVTGKATLVRKVLKQLEEAGTHHRAASTKQNAAGRTITFKGWYPTNHAALSLVPEAGTSEDAGSPADEVRPPDVCLRGTRIGGTHSETEDESLREHHEEPDVDQLEQVITDPTANGHEPIDADDLERLLIEHADIAEGAA